MSSVTLPGTAAPLMVDIEQLFREHYELVYRTAYGVTGSTEEAEDVLQTIFLRLVRQAASAGIRRDAKAYLYRAAVNLSLNRIRSRKREPFRFTNDAERFPSRAPERETEIEEEMYRHLYAAITELEPETAHIVVLRYVHDYSDSQIGQLLGMSRGAVAVRLFRARRQLKKLIRASFGERL